MKVHSQIELFKPEQMPGNELKLITPTSSPTIGNTPVSCCGKDLYYLMIEYAANLVRNKRSNYEPIDLVHDALLVNELNEVTYKKIILGNFYKEKQASNMTATYNDVFTFKKPGADFLICKKCSQELPSYAFRKNKFNFYDGICKKCQQEIRNKECDELDDNYVRRIIRDKRCPDNDLSYEAVEIKKTELLLTRISTAFKYKNYAHRRKKSKKI